MPESGTSGSVRDRDGKPPGLLDLHSYRKAKRWYRLRAAHYLPEVMQGMLFKDGLRVEQDAA